MCNGTEVVNIKKYRGVFTYIGRGSLFGNPFRIGTHGTRDEVIVKYKQWFYDKLEDLVFKDRVLGLKGKVLGCFCKPQKCHGDVIKEYLDGS